MAQLFYASFQNLFYTVYVLRSVGAVVCVVTNFRKKLCQKMYFLPALLSGKLALWVWVESEVKTSLNEWADSVTIFRRAIP